MSLYTDFFPPFPFCFLHKLNFSVRKSADNNESFKHKMSDNKNNEKRNKMDKRIQTLEERQKTSWKSAHRPESILLILNHKLYSI